MVWFFVVVVVVLATALVLIGVRHHRSNRGFLEWDPQERVKWRAEQVDVDVDQMLAMTNANRVKAGKSELTLAEYEEQVRRNRR